MAYPKIIYTPSGGSPTTLTFTYPPVNKPGTKDDNVAERFDTLAVSGVKQSVWYRTDIIKNLQMDFVPNADLTNWEAFFSHALTGGQFDYYPDASLGTFDTYTLEDKSWKPRFANRAWSKFSFSIRKVVPAGVAS